MNENYLNALIEKALDMRNFSYAPYSRYKVGAALLCEDGEIYGGCNIENSSYGAANCAERTAIFKAVSDGKTKFRHIVIAGGPATGPIQYAFPCGICRQVMREFCNPETFLVTIAKSKEDYKTYTLAELLPESFGPENLLD